ncbi:MAG: CPBP family intramembrane glutamic endopeptidase [Pseudomonadota bacterium]|nr:CPBP family intramembrane glutamic endopeptidase [Pseudomonadota bacterium]
MITHLTPLTLLALYHLINKKSRTRDINLTITLKKSKLPISLNRIYRMSNITYPQTTKGKISLTLLMLIALMGIIFSQVNEKYIFPSITTPISLDKDQAIAKAKTLNKESPLALQSAQAAASYQTNTNLINYLSLEDKTNNLLNQTIDNKITQTSFWTVRLYTSGKIQENHFIFAPNGSNYGFSMILPENLELPSLTKNEASTLAKETLKTYKMEGINTNDYTLKDYAQDKKPSRVDHRFTFENSKKSLSEAKLQIIIVISGDKVSKVLPSIKLPENFLKDYNNMRSYNLKLGSYGQTFILLGYGTLALLALYIGGKKRQINWKENLCASITITIIMALSNCNFLPLQWFGGYETTQSSGNFILNYIGNTIYGSLYTCIHLTVIFCCAEYLTRKSLPDLPQLWSFRHFSCAQSKTIGYLVSIGYVIFGISVGYSAAFYLIAQKIPTVWIPTGPLFDPDIISTYIPFYMPISLSIQAGVMEECLFRALPIASFLLLGRKFKQPLTALIFIIPTQAIIFGLAHAAYPQQPSFIRVIELAIPFTLYGLVYIKYGLLPCITAHYLFDVYQMSLMLFNMKTTGIWIQQLGCVLGLCAPFLWIMIAKIKHTKHATSGDLPKEYLNKNWTAPDKAREQPSTKPIQEKFTPKQKISLYVIGLVSLCVFFHSWNKTPVLASTLNITKAQALQKAKKIAQEQKLDLSKPWKITAIAKIETPVATKNIGVLFEDSILKYLIEKSGRKDTVNLLKNTMVKTDTGNLSLDSFLPHYSWEIRYALFEGTQDEKTNGLIVKVNNSATTFNHIQSENTKLPSLTETQVLTNAKKALLNFVKGSTSYDVIKKSSHTNPNGRVDWSTVFEFKTNQEIIKPRVQITYTGNQIASITPYLHIPEKWVHYNDMIEGTTLRTYFIFKTITTSVITLFTIIIAAMWFIQSKPNFAILSKILVGLISIMVISFINRAPEYTHLFSTTTNINNTWTITITSTLIYVFFTAVLICLWLHYTISKQSRFLKTNLKEQMLLGVCAGVGQKAIILGASLFLMPESLWKYGNINILSSHFYQLNYLTSIPSVLYGLLMTSTLCIHSSIACQHKKAIHMIWVTTVAVILSSQTSANTLIYTASLDATLVVCGIIYIGLLWRSLKQNPLALVVACGTILVSNNILNIKSQAFPGFTACILGLSFVVLGTTFGLIKLCQNHQKTKAS